MSTSTRKGATQPFTISLPLKPGTVLTANHTVIWMLKRNESDSDEDAVIAKRLSDGGLWIIDDGSEDGIARLRGILSSPETQAIFTDYATGREVTFESEIRVITPPPENYVQPRVFQRITISDAVIDQIEHDEV